MIIEVLLWVTWDWLVKDTIFGNIFILFDHMKKLQLTWMQLSVLLWHVSESRPIHQQCSYCSGSAKLSTFSLTMTTQIIRLISVGRCPLQQMKVAHVIALFHWQFWPHRVNPCCTDLRFFFFFLPVQMQRVVPSCTRDGPSLKSGLKRAWSPPGRLWWHRWALWNHSSYNLKIQLF